MKSVCTIILILLLSATEISAQAADFISIRKRGLTVKTFLKGAYARFITTNGEWIESRITDIQNDTLYFREILVRQVATPWGVPSLDTIATPIRGIHYQEIGGVPRPKEGFSYVKNGTLPMIGGAGYVLLNVINGAYLDYSPFAKQNVSGVAIATGIFGVGLLMNRLHRPYIKIGNKYSVEYIKAKGT